MRDPNRIGLILGELEKYWRDNPDLRPGQIISNMAAALGRSDCFHVEDDQMLKALEYFTKDIENQNTELKCDDESIAKSLLEDLNKMSMDDMDEFDKYDYYKDNMEDKIKTLCHQSIDDSPKLIEVMDIHDLSEIEKDIYNIYKNDNVCMGEILASTGVNNISLEDAMELYAKIMHKAEKDTFVQFYTEFPYLENDDYRIIGE